MGKRNKYRCSYKTYVFILLSIIMAMLVLSSENKLEAANAYYDSWKQVSTSTKSLDSGNYSVKENIEILTNDGESGLVITKDVNLYIAEGKTLSVTGGVATGLDNPSGAGIEISEGATLRVFGKGTIRATGGNGLVKDIAQDTIQDVDTKTQLFAAGAGIGGKGGLVERVESKKTTTSTTVVLPQAMGSLYVYDQVSIVALSGQAQEAHTGSANIGSGGGTKDITTPRGKIYRAKSANISDLTGLSETSQAAEIMEMNAITFDNQAGNGEVLTYAVPNTALGSLESLPRKEGYEFLGYYSQANGLGIQYLDALGNSTNTIWDASSSTIYAAWKEKTYTLSIVQDGIDHVTIEHHKPNANGTYTLPYGTQVMASAIASNGKIFVGWYGNLDGYTSREVKYALSMPASDIKLHVIATQTGKETPQMREDTITPRYANVNISVNSDGKPCDMGLVTLVSEHGNRLMANGNNGSYSYTKTVDYEKENYEILIGGKKSGKVVSFESEGTKSIAINYYQQKIYTTLNNEITDLGEISLRNKLDQSDTIQMFYDPALGYASYYALENTEDTYEIKVAGQWMKEAVMFNKKQDIAVALYRASVHTSLDDMEKNIGEVTLRNEAGEIVHTLHRVDGVHQKIATDTNEYFIYVNGSNTFKKMKFNGSETISYFTVSYEISDPDVRGKVPQSQVYLEGTNIRVASGEDLVRAGHQLIGWRSDRQLYPLESELLVNKRIQFYDTWQSVEQSNENKVSFWVNQYGFETLDEAVVATQMINSDAFGVATIYYDQADEKERKEIYGTLPNGYILKGKENGNLLIVPKGKTLIVGDKNSKDDSDVSIVGIDILVDGGVIELDGQHTNIEQGKISLLPGNTIHLVTNIREDRELLIECLDTQGKLAVMKQSTLWKQDSVIVSSDIDITSMWSNVRILNDGYAVSTHEQSESGKSELRLFDAQDIVATTKYKQAILTHRSIQEAIDNSLNKDSKEINVLKDSNENLILYGNEITLHSAKRWVEPSTKKVEILPDTTPRTLSGDLQIKDNADGSETIYHLEAMNIVNPLRLDQKSKIKVSTIKQWGKDEMITLHMDAINDKTSRILIDKASDENHFRLSKSLLIQGYELFDSGTQVSMKYYGKAIEIMEHPKDIDTSENEVFTLACKASYEIGISDDVNLSDPQYQDIQYKWQRKLRDQSDWEDMDSTKTKVNFQDGIAHVTYTKEASAKDRNYVYRCLVWNKTGVQANVYPATREVSVRVNEAPLSFVSIPKEIKLQQDSRKTRGNSEYEELSTSNEITLKGYKENLRSNDLYEVYTKPTFLLTQKNMSLNGYTIHVLNEQRQPLEADELLTSLQKGKNESERFYLYGTAQESKMVGVYKGIMTFRIQRTQK